MLTALSLCLVFANAAPDTEITSVFNRYREALVSGDAAAAARAVHPDDLAYFVKMRDLAMTGSADTVKKLSIVDRMTVIRLRHDSTAEGLRKMTGADLLALAINLGWVSANTVR